MSASARCACSSARSEVTVIKALICGSSAAILASFASTSSTGDSSRAPMSRAASAIVMKSNAPLTPASCPSVGGDIRVLDDARPLHHFRLRDRAILLRRAGRRLQPLHGKPLLDVVHLQNLTYLGVEQAYDSRRRPGGRKNAE